MEKKTKKSKKVYLEVAVKESNVESSDGKEKTIKTTKKTNTEPLIDAADGSAVKEKEKLPKKKKRKVADDKPVEPDDCTDNQEVTETKLKKKTLKNKSENAEEVEEEQQTGERKQINKGKKRKCEASVVTEGSGENFTGVKQKKKYDEEAHKASDGICVAKKKKKAKTVAADQVETEPLEEDAVEDDGVKQVKRMKKSKKEKTEDVEKAENEDGAIKKKKTKSKKSETVKEEEMVSEKKVKKEKSKKASVEATEVEEEETVKKKKKKKSQQLNGEEKEQQTVECEDEQSGETDMVSKKKKKKPSESSEEQTEQDKCDAGAKKRKKIREKGDDQQESSQVDVVFLSAKCGGTDEVTINQERRQALQNDVDQASQPATPTKPEGFGQWSTAQFDSADQQQKFLRLMGGFKKGFQPASGTPGKANMALGKDAQLQLQQGLQGQFERAHSRRVDSGNRGAGLGFAAPSNKKFFIDVNASRSVRFDD